MKLDFCVACGTRENLIYHHLKPKVYGGEDSDDNLLTLCQYHHGIIHSYEWRGNLSELIKHGQAKAKADGKRVHGTPEEMEKLNENQRSPGLRGFLTLRLRINVPAKYQDCKQPSLYKNKPIPQLPFTQLSQRL